MAKWNSIPDFLKDLADGIRQAEGSTAKINPQDFRRRVEALTRNITIQSTLFVGNYNSYKEYRKNGQIPNGAIVVIDDTYKDDEATLIVPSSIQTLDQES